jgi:uncharacterized membrane protein SpoIIM required for sporulation
MAAGALGDFIKRRKPAWDALSGLILRTGTASGIRSLSRAELKTLGPLYRRTAADLAYARLRGADPALIQYLNDLVLRAHGLLYAERGPSASQLRQFILVGFPRLLRKRRVAILLATLLFVLGGVMGAVLTLANPNNGHIFLGERADDVDFYKNLATSLTDSERPRFSVMLMDNNIKVAILAFAVGILGAIPTLIILFTNGLPIGALAVLQHNAGYDVVLWSFLLPHGVPELSAIFIAGGAGMIIGQALVAPGELSRRDAIVLAGRDAVRLVFGAVMLLVIAGFTESFISPAPLPAWAKFTYAACGALALGAYVRSGKDKDGEDPHPPAPSPASG